MIEYAEREFSLSRRGADGTTRRDLLAAAGMPAVDDDPPPAELAYLLVWWSELSAARTPGMAGPSPIDYCEIESWARLTGRRLSPREVNILRQVDDAFLRSLSDG